MMIAQVGWGKSDYVESGIHDGSVAGAVLSPRDDEPSSLSAYASSLQTILKGGGLVLFDPQFYATTIASAKDGKLPSYPYYVPSLTRASFGPANVQTYAESVLDFQSGLALDRWISPTVLFSGFRDPWSQAALSLAQASIDTHKTLREKKPLLVSLVLDEQALRDRHSLDEYLDTISTFDAKGFYVIVRRNDPNYPAAYEEDVIVNLMYMTYVLADRNSFEVVHGYTDLPGILLSPAGATAVGTGWYSNLRQFSMRRFLPASGGRQPKTRYTSKALLNSVFINPELEQIRASGGLSSVLSGTIYDSILSPKPLGAPWPLRTSTLHHWKVLSNLIGIIESGKGITQKLDSLEKMIGNAGAMYAALTTAGVTFDSMTGPRDLALWQKAVKRFRSEIGK